MKVAVVAHAEKMLGGGLPELRRVLEAEGIPDPLWYEVPKAKKASERVKRALDEGAQLIFAWGGDGTVRRCVEVLAGGEATLAVVPAGTANLFATNLGIPDDIEEAVAIGLRGDRRRLDVGRFEKERFAVMAGAGFDAAMIRDADDLKERIGRARLSMEWIAPPARRRVRCRDRCRRLRLVRGQGHVHPAREPR